MSESKRDQTGRRCLPPTKPKEEELQIVSQGTSVVNPTLRLELVGLREDFWISGDGPEA